MIDFVVVKTTIFFNFKVPEYVLKELTEKFNDNEIDEDQAYDR